MDTYLRSKFLARLSQHQKLIKSNINPEKYWGFIEHLKDYFVITGLDVELRKQIIPYLGKHIFRINLEIYIEKTQINYNELRKIFQLYFYETHDINYGQDYIFITMNDDLPIFPIHQHPYEISFPVHNVSLHSKHY